MTTTRLTGPQMVAVQTATQHLPHRMSMPYTGNVTTVDQLVAFLTTYAAHAEKRHARASAEGREAQRAVTALRSLRYALGLTTEALQVHDAEVAQADAIRAASSEGVRP